MPTIKSIWRRSGWLTSYFQRSEVRSLRSLSRSPEAKDLLASGGDGLGCGGDKDIVSSLKGGFRTGRRGPRVGAQVDFKAVSHRARR